MRLFGLCVAFLLFFSISLSTRPRITKEDEYIVSISIPRGMKDLDTLVNLGFNLDHPRADRSQVHAYVDSDDLQQLDELGFNYLPLELPTREARAEAWRNEINTPKQRTRSTEFNWYWDMHHNYELLTATLQNVHQMYPNITRLFSIGKTKQGRELWVMEISDQPGKNEAGEPEFKYIANMHGDEVVGREVVLRLIVELCETYYSSNEKSNEKLWSRTNIRRLVDSTDIFLMPSMNPDGYERNSRYNSNFQDLNRVFPDRIAGTPTQLEIEVRSVMNWISSKNFVLSANYHGGEVVANYPWDGNTQRKSGLYTPTPDDELFKHISLTYSMSHLNMYKNPYFPRGITNGADWYVLYGGMQDWNYVNKGCFEITLEISMTKTPRGSSLPDYWNENRDSTIAFLQLVHTGIKGFVRNSSGAPLSASISIEGIDHAIKTDPENGDYYRLVAPRTAPYVLAVTVGSATQKYTFTVTEDAPLVTHDFIFNV